MKLKNTSATQVETWTACPRAWHFQWVRGFKEPPTASMQRGTHIHAAAEFAQKNGGKLPDNEWAAYARSMLPHLPIGKDKVLVEHMFTIPTGKGLPPWLGYIDLVDDSRTFTPHLRIYDYKTTSDFRYAKTPQELSENSQVSSYAKWAYENGHDEEFVQVGHLYILTAKKTPKTPRVLPVLVDIDQPQVETVWARDLVKIEDMVHAAEIANTEKLEPKGTSNGQCKKYGGCPHRSRCGITQETGFGFGKAKEAGTMSNDFLKRLQEKKAATNGANAHGPVSNVSSLPKVSAKAPTGVLPPDAAPRTTPVKTKAPAVEAEIDHAEPQGVAEVAAAAVTKRPVGRPRKEKTAAASGDGFALYIDCMPVKDVSADLEPTLFEDWVNPIRLSLNDETMKAKNLPDYRLLPFSEEKALFGLALNEKIGGGNMPPALIFNSSSPGARDALDVLIPHAKFVVRGLRG